MTFDVPEGTTHFMFHLIPGVHWNAYCTVDQKLWVGSGPDPETAWADMLTNRAAGVTLSMRTAANNEKYRQPVRSSTLSHLKISLDL